MKKLQPRTLALVALSLVTAAASANAQPVRVVTRTAQFPALRGREDTGRGTARDALATGGLHDGNAQSFTQLRATANAQTAIRRSTAGSSNIGEFREDSGAPAAPSAPRARGDVGSTGTVDRERGPQGAMRGSSGAAPGEIDFSRPIGGADVARLLRTQEPRLRTCYDAARATRPRLAGRASLRLVVSRTGELTNVEVTGFPDAPSVAPCMAAELRQVRFPRPENGVLPFNLAMNFSPPPAPPPRVPRPRSRPR